MRWNKVKGVRPETWAMLGLRIKRTPKGFLLFDAQLGLPGIAPKFKPQSFNKLTEAKRWGKTILELG